MRLIRKLQSVSIEGWRDTAQVELCALDSFHLVPAHVYFSHNQSITMRLSLKVKFYVVIGCILRVQKAV